MGKNIKLHKKEILNISCSPNVKFNHNPNWLNKVCRHHSFTVHVTMIPVSRQVYRWYDEELTAIRWYWLIPEFTFRNQRGKSGVGASWAKLCTKPDPSDIINKLFKLNFLFIFAHSPSQQSLCCTKTLRATICHIYSRSRRSPEGDKQHLQGWKWNKRNCSESHGRL